MVPLLTPMIINAVLLPLIISLFISPEMRNDESFSTMEIQMSSGRNNNKNKRLILIRHGRTHMNEYLSKPGNMWGDAGFTDVGLPDKLYRDSPLCHQGVIQAKELCRKIQHDTTTSNGNGNNSIIDDIDLVVVSPLTRAFQTLEYGLLPHLVKSKKKENIDKNKNDHLLDSRIVCATSLKVPIITLPLASERVYLKSDLGLPAEQLKTKFPYADMSIEFEHFEYEWWFTVKSQDDGQRNNNINGKKGGKDVHSFNFMEASEYVEWRPNTDGQIYECLGEPDKQFHERMIALYKWLESREESNIVLISHWGVLDWLTGIDFENCEMKDTTFDSVRQRIETKHRDVT